MIQSSETNNFPLILTTQLILVTLPKMAARLGMHTLECGWPTVQCGWPTAQCGWPTVQCGWPTVQCGWPTLKCGWHTLQCMDGLHRLRLCPIWNATVECKFMGGILCSNLEIEVP